MIGNVRVVDELEILEPAETCLALMGCSHCEHVRFWLCSLQGNVALETYYEPDGLEEDIDHWADTLNLPLLVDVEVVPLLQRWGVLPILRSVTASN